MRKRLVISILLSMPRSKVLEKISTPWKPPARSSGKIPVMFTILTWLMCEEKSQRCCVRIRHHTSSSSLYRTLWLNSHQCLKTSIQPSRLSAIQATSIRVLNNSKLIPNLGETKAYIINQCHKHSIKTLHTSLEAICNISLSSHRSSKCRRLISEMKEDTTS